jgi:putative transposase
MCRVFRLHRSGFYAWLDRPLSNRAIEDQRLLKLIKESYLVSGATYGSPWIHRDLLDSGEHCSVHCVAKIMRSNKLRAQIGYKRRYIEGGEKGKIADNILDRQFSTDAP